MHMRWGAIPPIARPSKRIVPRSGLDEAGHKVEQRRLARAVGSDQGRHRAAAHGKAGARDGPQAAEILCEAIDRENGIGG